MLLCYFAIRNEFLCDSSRIEPILPNIRDEILSESGLTRTPSRLEKCFLMKPHESPPESIKNQFVAIRAIRGLCGIGVLHCHDFGHDGATTHPDLSSRDASA